MNPDRTILTERREWVVNGVTAHADVFKALHGAIASYRKHHSIPDGAATPEDAVRVMPRDKEIVVFYEVEVDE